MAWLSFLFHPEVRIAQDDEGLRLSRGSVEIQMSSQLPIDVQDAVWWPDMGSERVTKRARIRVARGLSEVITILRVNLDN